LARNFPPGSAGNLPKLLLVRNGVTYYAKGRRSNNTQISGAYLSEYDELAILKYTSGTSNNDTLYILCAYHGQNTGYIRCPILNPDFSSPYFVL
jgi:hypothetical protein